MKRFIRNTFFMLLGFFGFVTSSFAVLPAAATTAFTDLQTDALALVDLAWVSLVPITIAFIILRMFRRAANSGS